MNPGAAAIGTAIVVLAGNWAKDKKTEPKVIVGAGFLAVMLSLMSESNEKLAGQFALLIFVGAVLVNGGAIASKISKVVS